MIVNAASVGVNELLLELIQTEVATLKWNDGNKTDNFLSVRMVQIQLFDKLENQLTTGIKLQSFQVFYETYKLQTESNSTETYSSNFCRLGIDGCCTWLQLLGDLNLCDVLRQLQTMEKDDTSTPQQGQFVSHQGIEFDDMVVDVAFPLSYRNLSRSRGALPSRLWKIHQIQTHQEECCWNLLAWMAPQCYSRNLSPKVQQPKQLPQC